ncbi:MAG: UDP-N-acetylmuramate--L-alanine ligase [Candidatus Moranbacteria bacterium RIFOXYA12_FULL_35_19]|nr:MAG: UDP-N-acetylmuramate-L-alanine ligase [Candidatus Moranbacteria bacterium GW2011_GWF2_35_39]OGI32694.1 MAG: UDP-N-acetylmuramate--L-alanine ligase [Candidatus Moranbacteria bacterium RIFOXYC12_FULL_36_13]OGI36704.1 MAG: UDP-N-acetylmuramate--L-alanine ligase [Candidatus Moranbacteria bacterium RIFOXYA12_FULL_35_19]
MSINLNNLKKAYIIGIKGSGVIAVVEILHSMGIEITGSDTNEKFFTDEILQKLSIQYFEKFSPENIPADTDLVIYSTAYNENNNIEFQEAKKRNLEMISYPEILAELFNEKYGIAVCGTHGKTTTSAMLAHTLKEIGVDPSAVIGSRVINWEGNALSGKGEFFVAETDEFQNKLKLYNPKAIVLTSLDFDHPDTFPNFADYKKAFKDFVARIPKTGFLVVWGDSVDTLEVSKEAKCQVLTYGFNEENNYKITNYKLQNLKQFFEVSYSDKSLGVFEIQLTGKHNVLNACAVIATCHKLNLDLEKIKEGLASFSGTKRRFEYIGERNGAILIDDYGHHPEEIKATLKGAREIYPQKNIWAVFHPHSYSRTEALLQEFSQSFSDANQVIILDIYGSARENFGKISSKDLVDLINKYDRDKAQYIKTIDEAVEFLRDKIGSEDVVIAIGAGNGWEVAEKLNEK